MGFSESVPNVLFAERRQASPPGCSRVLRSFGFGLHSFPLASFYMCLWLTVVVATAEVDSQDPFSRFPCCSRAQKNPKFCAYLGNGVTTFLSYFVCAFANFTHKFGQCARVKRTTDP